MTIALACVLAAFGAFKLWIALAAVARLRAWRAGRAKAGDPDPMTGFRGPVVFWGWVWWRIAAGLLALAAAGWIAFKGQ